MYLVQLLIQKSMLQPEICVLEELGVFLETRRDILEECWSVHRESLGVIKRVKKPVTHKPETIKQIPYGIPFLFEYFWRCSPPSI